MKKTKLFGLLALASCVSLMSACDLSSLKFWEKKEEKNSQKEEDKKGDTTVEITVANLPEKLEVGESLDLSKYVTLKNATAFEVEVAQGSQALATVKDGKLTATGEGKIDFSIKAGSASKSCSITGFSSDRAIVESYFEGFGHEYTVFVYTSGESSWALKSAVYHRERYFYNTDSEVDKEQNTVAGGLLKYSDEDEDCYEFVVNTNESEEEEVELKSIYGSDLLDAYNADFEPDWESAVCTYDSEYDEVLFVLSELDAMDFAQSYLGAWNGAYWGYFPYSSIEFTVVDLAEEGEEPDLEVWAYAYVQTSSADKAFVGMCRFFNDPEVVGYDLLDEHCVPENKPEVVDYYNSFFADEQFSDKSYYHNKLSDFLLGSSFAGKEGIVGASYSWLDASTYQPCEAPYFESYFYSQNFPVGSDYMLMSENNVWHVSEYIVDEETGNIASATPIYGDFESDGHVYQGYKRGDGSYDVTLVPEISDVWEHEDFLFGALQDSENWKLGGISDYDYDETSFSVPVHSFSLRTEKSKELIDSLFTGIEELTIVLADIAEYNADPENGGQDMYSLFSTYLSLNYEENIAQFDIMFGGFYSYGYIYYVTISFEINESVAPIVSEFATAASPYIPGLSA